MFFVIFDKSGKSNRTIASWWGIINFYKKTAKQFTFTLYNYIDIIQRGDCMKTIKALSIIFAVLFALSACGKAPANAVPTLKPIENWTTKYCASSLRWALQFLYTEHIHRDADFSNIKLFLQAWLWLLKRCFLLFASESPPISK